MKTYDKMLALLMLVVIAFLLPACAREKIYRIGISQCSQDDWRRKMNDEINREAMFHEDVAVEIRSADDSNARQIADIRYFADNGFDIIIVSPNEAAALTPVIEEVYARGIPVIIFDRNIIGQSYTARIGVDDEAIGRSAAHYASHLLPGSPKAIEICGRTGSTPASGRHKGFTEEFGSAGGEVLASCPADWNSDDAQAVADSLLAIYTDVDLIYAHNDRMAIAASEVARRLGRDDIKVIGIDAAPEIGIRAVADGVIDATFLYPTEGHRLVRTALAVLRGEHYDRETILPASSAVDSSNADILLLQNEALREETDKIRLLKAQMDDYWARHSSQTSLFYASIAIILLLVGVIFLVLRMFWQNKRHQKTLLEQYAVIERERDKQRELNERLQEATQSKLMFFTNVSHDLRTPLTLIAEPVAQLAASPGLDARQKELMRLADRNVHILRRLINQILDFRKYENGRLTLTLTETDAGAAVESWTESFQSLARKRQITLRLERPSGDAPVRLAMDVEKMERVFFNLLSNAFKYTPDNGTITVSYAVAEGRFTLRVSDTGEGIGHSDIENIFDRFYQVERVHPDGSGIGLSLCKAFVELHGGTIGVKSRLTVGSEFTVTLPVRHVADEAADASKRISVEEVDAELDSSAAEPKPDGSKPLLLVIDDNRDIQTLLTALLSPEYDVITASDGSAGLRKAMRYVPDLIVCDVMMPGIDGLECCRRLKAELSTSHIPVLMLTACSMDEQRVQGYESGADGYLSKPFSGDVLRARCESLIRNRKRIRELWTSSSPRQQQESAPEEKRRPKSDIDNDFYDRFVALFTAEMGNPDITVDSIAARLGMERTQLYRKIKALTNFSPVELMRTLRLREARRLLTTTDSNISEIAYATGFSTPAYFSKCYRDAYGETPTEVRKKANA